MKGPEQIVIANFSFHIILVCQNICSRLSGIHVDYGDRIIGAKKLRFFYLRDRMLGGEGPTHAPENPHFLHSIGTKSLFGSTAAMGDGTLLFQSKAMIVVMLVNLMMIIFYFLSLMTRPGGESSSDQKFSILQ